MDKTVKVIVSLISLLCMIVLAVSFLAVGSSTAARAGSDEVRYRATSTGTVRVRFGSIRVQPGQKVPKRERQVDAEAGAMRTASTLCREYEAIRYFSPNERIVGLLSTPTGMVTFSLRADQNGSVYLGPSDMNAFPSDAQVFSWCDLILVGESSPPFGYDADLLEDPGRLFNDYYQEPEAVTEFAQIDTIQPIFANASAYRDVGYLSYGDTASGNLIGIYDVWYFDGSAGDVIGIYMGSDTADTFLQLYYNEGDVPVLMWLDDDSGGDLNAYINGYTLPYTGAYSIMASGFNNQMGPYEISLWQESPPQVQTCPNALEPRLTVGQQGMVIPGMGVNNVRDQPAIDAKLIGTLPEGGVFTVLDGPSCSESYTWWQVNYNGLVGWTSESHYNTYWLRPY